MLLFMRKQKTLRQSSIKLLDFACTECSANVNRVFEGGGIGVLFAVFMTFWVSTEKIGADAAERDSTMVEHFMAIMFSLFRYTDDEGRRRLASKFVEGDGAKLRRLLVLYAERLESSGLRRGDQDDDSGNEVDPGSTTVDELFVLQLCAVVIAHVAVTSSVALTDALRTGLAEVGGLSGVGSLVRRYAENFVPDTDFDTEATENRAEHSSRLSPW
jgi:hypothetical protein